MGGKFALYRDIPNLKEYVLIDSSAVHIQLFKIIAQNHWELIESKSKEDSISIPSLGIKLAIKEVYEGIDFA